MERRKWECPECNRAYRIPRSAADPGLCPACRERSDRKWIANMLMVCIAVLGTIVLFVAGGAPGQQKILGTVFLLVLVTAAAAVVAVVKKLMGQRGTPPTRRPSEPQRTDDADHHDQP